LDSHLAEETILRWLDGEVSDDEERRTRDHLETCEACRLRLEDEGRFNLLLRRGLQRRPAPARLKRRIRYGLAAAGDARGRRRPASVPVAMAAAVAIALAGILAILLPYGLGRWAPGNLDSGAAGPAVAEPGVTARAPRPETVRGHLVCIGCARHHVDLALHRFCRGGGDREHITGLQTHDGTLWHFVENDVVTSLLDRPDLRGREVTLEARLYRDIHYVQVAAVREL
jgi:anti-sigma factor RsiW